MIFGQKISFWNFINDEDINKIEIPNIQRDYVQGRRDEKVRFALDKLLTDMHNAILNKEALDLNYIYGKIDNAVFIPIDGQQRLTTLLTLHIYAFAKENKIDELKVLREKFQYNTRISTARFLKAIIDNLHDYFTENYRTISEYIEDSVWFSVSWKKDPSVISFMKVLDLIDNKFKNNTFANELKSADCPITYMGLSIQNMGNENDLYIKMNSRGKSLTEFEIFKSQLFDYIDNNIDGTKINNSFVHNFKQLADNDWMSAIWDSCNVPEIECDKRYLHLWHWIILNNILLDSSVKYDDKINDIINNNGFYNFTNYKAKMSNCDSILNIYSTMQLFDWLCTKHSNIYKNTIVNLFKKIDTDNMKERVILFALTKYATVIDCKFDEDSFKAWYRIVNNLVKNTEIDKEEKYRRACQSIEKLPKNCFENATKYFAKLTLGKSGIEFFANEQIDEEILKARLIDKNSSWYDLITKAEQFEYFEGQIGFMFKLQNINGNNLLFDADILEEFDKNWNIISQLFSKEIIDHKDNLLNRAILIYGDYSIIANSSNTFFFEGGNEYYNWRRMLRETKSFAVFKKLFADLKAKQFTNMETVLYEIISNYSYTNEFDYCLITLPEIFSFMRENRYKEIDANNKKRIIIYKKARLSAEYAEIFTYALKVMLSKNNYKVDYKYGTGYPEADTSLAYIEKINDKEIKIEYYNNTYYLNDKELLNSNGNKITKVDEAYSAILAYIKSN